MSEQIITILLSTLLGGAIAITGSLVNSYVIHRQITTDEQRKELREAIEKIYKLIMDTEGVYANAIQHRGNREEEKSNITLLRETIQNLSMLVHLYVPALMKETTPFISKVNAPLLSEYYNKRLEFEEYNNSVALIFHECMIYRDKLAKFLQENRNAG